MQLLEVLNPAPEVLGLFQGHTFYSTTSAEALRRKDGTKPLKARTAMVQGIPRGGKGGETADVLGEPNYHADQPFHSTVPAALSL